jgi:hypothetical protein
MRHGAEKNVYSMKNLTYPCVRVTSKRVRKDGAICRRCATDSRENNVTCV